MRKLISLIAAVAMVTAACQQEVESYPVVDNQTDQSVDASRVRSYDEALSIAEEALSLLDGDDTRSSHKRIIKRNEGQVVMSPVTRGGEEEPIMYIFNNENNEGFTIVAANRSVQPLIAVTESGNYTYGEPTGVEPLDVYMDNVASTLMITPPSIPEPTIPLEPKPGYYADTVDIFERVDPRIETKWGQYGVYNALCDGDPAGCTATATAQFLAYHKHPSVLQITFEGLYYGQSLVLNWDRLLVHRDSNCQNMKCRDFNHIIISQLFREIGERLDMDYGGVDGSGASNENVLNFLQSLGFACKMHENGVSYSVIRNNLREGNPVYVCGYRYYDQEKRYIGHAWLADGFHYKKFGIYRYMANPNYDPSIIYNNPEPEYIRISSEETIEDLIHFNWGYDGECDGWFATNNIHMSEAVEYDSPNSINYDRDYKYYMSMICDIKLN